jgi:hypothetical protein
VKNKNINPYIIFRIPEKLQIKILEDLRRPHGHASERVGFVFTKSKWLDKKTVLIIATSYQPVADEDYIEDKSVGAKIGSNAIRTAMQSMFNDKSGCFHVHLHDHNGIPAASGIDSEGLPGVVESLSNISGDQATGFLILSKDNFFSAIQLPNYAKLKAADVISVVGFPMQFHYKAIKESAKNSVFDRQLFLGAKSQLLFENVRVGIVGYGGGGSHVGQQFAHIGIKHPIVFDEDFIEDTNLNRLVGGQWKDVLKKVAKISIARRVIKSILPSANVTAIKSRWQDAPEKLQRCDLVVGCVDTYAERQQLESECRRYLIPYVDIGMDIHQIEEEATSMSGQIMLSLPGLSCFWCHGFLTEEKLGKEAAKYGNVGGRPQVVWPNGVLASTAVGIIVELITGWTGRKNARIYLEYDGNAGILKDHVRIRFCDEYCSHYPIEKAGSVRFATL